MKTTNTIIVLLLLLSVNLCNAQEISSEDSAKIEGIFYYYTGKIPGAMISVLKKDKEIYTQFFGLADAETKEKLSRDNLFYLSSVGKVYTVMAILKLSESGKLSLQESIYDIYPSLPEYYKDVKIENLLSHTSGLPRYDEEQINSFSELLQFVKDQDSLLFKPGDRWLYSNIDYKLLANIVEVKSKKTYESFLKKKIFRKMKVSKNQFVNQIDKELVPKGYEEKSLNFKEINQPNNGILGEKETYASLDDIVSIVNATFYGINSPIDNYTKPYDHFINNLGNKINYGYAWYIVPQDKANPDKTIYWLGGKDAGYQNVIVHFPDDDITVLLFMNRGNSFNSLVKIAVGIGKLAIE